MAEQVPKLVPELVTEQVTDSRPDEPGAARSSSPRILLLTRPGAHQRYVAAQIHRQLPLTGILIEDKSPRTEDEGSILVRFLKKRVPPLHLLLSKIKELLTVERRERRTRHALDRLQTAAESELEARVGGLPDQWPAVERRTTRNANAKSSVAWAGELEVDYLVVYGTGILKTPMIKQARKRILNAHSSLLPFYRGSQSEFWQVLEGGLAHAGTTIHVIDEGVDTGDIVLQRAATVEGTADPFKLRCANVLMTADLFVEGIRGLESRSLTPSPQGSHEGPTRRFKDLTLERRAELVERLGFRV